VSAFRLQLDALLARFDEDGFVALANRGLLRRAQKDLEKLSVDIAEETSDALTVAFGEHRIRFDARGPSNAQCSCPASGVCQHILSAALGLQRLAATPPTTEKQGEPKDALEPLRDALLGMTASELSKYAGKAGYRWAWQFVHDMDDPQAITISGEQHVVITFQRPRMTLRYMGGGIEALIADIDIKQIEKYRVAAVLAFQRAHGVEPVASEPTVKARSEALDLGMDHRLATPTSESLDQSRQRFRASAKQLLAEAAELGLAHLSQGIHERFATLAVWAQGAEYYRLALLLRRIADHVEMLLDRAGGADEHRLLDEMTLAFAILCALDEAATRGLAPAHLVGQARSRYEASSSLELWGLGANAWRSSSGYLGLTMIFWSPADEAFYSCTDARPQSLRGFDPIARYKAAGPWGGLGAPAQAAGRRLILTGAQINAGGRLSAAESTTATVVSDDPPGRIAERLKPWTSWSELMQARGVARRSLLAESKPMQDWVFLRPARFGSAKFEEARQTLCWPLHDTDDQCLMAELAFDNYTSHALTRIEAHEVGANGAGAIVVARVRPGSNPLVVEPLSLVFGDKLATSTGRAVDALYFDAPAQQGKASKLLNRLTRGLSARHAPDNQPVTESRVPSALRQTRHELQRQAERGVAADQHLQWAGTVGALQDRAADFGLSAFASMKPANARAGEGILRLNFVCLQYENLFGTPVASLG
jgi:hypothetical protein